MYGTPNSSFRRASLAGSQASIHDAAQHHRSILNMICICAFNLPYGTICATMGLVVLSKEADSLFPTNPAMGLGLFLTLVGFTQLVCPYAGLLSDRCTHPLGRRRPYIMWGSVATVAMIGLMWWASHTLHTWVYLFALTVAMLALNVVYSGQTGLMPDLVSEAERGTASGITSVLMLLGSVTGFIFVRATAGMDFRVCYPLYMVEMVVFVSVLLINADEKQRPDLFPGDDLTWEVVMESYKVQTGPPGCRTRYDFAWVFGGRTSFYIAVSCQAFMKWYLRDMMGIAADDQQREQISDIVMIGQGVAASVAYPCGQLSDRLGRKPLVYTACLVMCTVYVGFLTVPTFATGQEGMSYIYGIAALYGLGNGCYLSVDLALAIDCLPDKENTARDLGVWGVAAFVGSALGPVLWAGVFTAVGLTPQKHFYTEGYVIMLTGGCLFAFAAGLLIKFIRGPK